MNKKIDVLGIMDRAISIASEDAEHFRAGNEDVALLTLAKDVISDLLAASRKFMRDYDEAQADAEDEWLIQPDAGCYECTLHTVPHDKDTGLCGYHATERALARVTP